MRKLNYCQAINEALHQLMESDERVFVIGQGLKSPWSFGDSTSGLAQAFGDRVIDPPVFENGMTGVAVGAAIAGMKPIVMHPRMDFMWYSMDQVVNHAASWCYMFGGKMSVSLVLRGVVNRGNEQAAQHSQALQTVFAHIPGLKVVMPSNPYDAKGLLVSAVKDGNPVVYIDDRWLYDVVGAVPEEMYEVPIGKACVKKTGGDVTVVATSYLVEEALMAEQELSGVGIEVVDVRSLKPLDLGTIVDSVKKTGRLVIADGSWKSCGFAAEVAAAVSEDGIVLKKPLVRVCQPDTPTPASRFLEDRFFQRKSDIVCAIKKVMGK
ncbi:MAG: alpha-ketoacid dehydrogenase subunit beta [Candidatus Altiarchaeota archaeon]|nr:alpha-ketoacid dehydrogenase subunit beta [Candidatus Altiarchaeota archaeon]